MRHLDNLRTARLRALSPSPCDDADPWGGSDEEVSLIRAQKEPTGAGRSFILFICCCGGVQPDEVQAELMRRTAVHVVRATNDAQLRARILAHHGADTRFAFLRGRWGRAWARAQAEARREVLAEREAQGALGGLTGYGSGSGSESEHSGGSGDGSGEDSAHVVIAQTAEERTTQEARRAKAREWAQKRRAERAVGMDGQEGTETSSNLSPS